MFPEPVHGLAERECLVADLPEAGKRDPLCRRALPCGGGHREEEVAQAVIRQLVARGRVELADLGEHERLRGAEGEEIARRGLAGQASYATIQPAPELPVAFCSSEMRDESLILCQP